MEYRDYLAVYHFLKADKKRLNEFGGLIQSLGKSEGFGRQFMLMSEQLQKLYEMFGHEPLPEDKHERREAIVYEVGRLKLGERAHKGPVYVSWLWNYALGSILSLLKTLDFDFDLINRDDIVFINSKSSYDAFICWSGPYAFQIGLTLREYFDEFPDHISVFFSDVDIQSGHWEGELKSALCSASRGIVLVTQDVIDSPYLDYEFAILSLKAQKPWIMRLDAPRAILGKVLERHQDKEFNERTLRSWIETVLTPKGLKLDKDSFSELWAKIEKIREAYLPTYVTSSETIWGGNIRRPILVNDQKHSPYDLQNCLTVAQSQVVLVGQNFWYMTGSPTGGHSVFWPLIARKLQEGVDITIVAMHPDVKPQYHDGTYAPDAHKLWSIYMETDRFISETDNSWHVFEKWHLLKNELHSESEGQKFGNLEIYGSYFTPLTLNFIDPESDRGFLTVSPRPAAHTAYTRPEIVIRKLHEREAFRYYWSTLNDVTQNQNIKLIYG